MASIIFTEGAGIADSVFGKSQAPIRMFLETRAEAFEQESMIPHLFSMGTSTSWGENFTSMTGMGAFEPVGENGAYPRTGMKEGYNKVLENMTWKSSFVVSQEAVEDAKLIDFKHQPTSFITSFHRTREDFAATLFAGGMSAKSSVKVGKMTFDTTGADGKPVVSADHPAAGKGAKQSNMFGDEFSVDALSAAECAMQDFRDDNGEILGITPDTILIPNDYKLKRDVFAAIGADKDPNTANNGANYQFGRWNVIVWPYLGKHLPKGARPWALIASGYNKETDAAPWLERVKLTVKSDIDPNTDANIWRGRARYIAGFVDWRFMVCCGVNGADKLIGE